MVSDTEQALEMLPCPVTRRGRVWDTLPKRSDFLRLSASRLRRVTPGFILQCAPRIPQAAPRQGEHSVLRIGFTASRKVGNAVARSRAKRRLRALVDNVMAQAADPARDYVLIARPEALARNFAAMEQELRQALAKLAQIKPAAAP